MNRPLGYCILSLLACLSAARGCEFVGVNQDFVWTAPNKRAPLIDAMRELGVRWVRLPLRWNVVQPEPGAFDWSRTDPVIDELRAADIRVLAILMSVPAWANGTVPDEVEGWYDAYPPRSLGDWEAYVRAAVERYGGRIRHWEIWNEQNGVDFYRPLPDAERYVALLRSAYRTIKSVQPDSVVLMGGLQMNGVIANPWSPVKVEHFLKGMYDAGAAGAFDAVNIHPYVTETDPVEGIGEMVRGTLEVLRRNGDAGRPIWITEIGVASRADPTGRLQADNLERTFVELRGFPEVTRVFWFCLMDYERDIVGPEASMGLLTRELVPKPAARSLRAATLVCDQIWEAPD